MNITFLIGNGFDLNLGLKTRYTDFISEYKQIKRTDSDLISSFKMDLAADKENWADAELAFGEYTKKFKVFENGGEKFCECHDDFCKNFAVYLDKQTAKISYPMFNAYHFVESINSFANTFGNLTKKKLFKGKQSADNILKTYNFIAFNYTNFIDEYVKKAKQYLTSPEGQKQLSNIEDEVIHVHGRLNQTMALGVNDSSQLYSKIFENYPEEYMSQIIKPESYRITDEDYFNETEEILIDSDIIYIYGMSLGETDKRWWKSIIDIMHEYKDKCLIIHYYDSNNKNFFRTTNLEHERRIKEKFINYSSADEVTKKEIKDRIFVTSANIFSPLKDKVTEYLETVNKNKARFVTALT